MTGNEEDSTAENRLLSAFQKIGAALLTSLDLNEVLDILAEEIISAGVFRSLMVALVERSPDEVVVVRSLSRCTGQRKLTDSPSVDKGRLRKRYSRQSSNIVAEIARTGVMEVIDGWDDRFEPDSKHEPFSDRVSYFIPVSNEQGTLAVLATGSTIAQKADTIRRIQTMQPLLDQAAVAIQHAQEYKRLQMEIAEGEASEAKYRALFENMQSGFALHEVIYDESGVPLDYIFLDMNNAFEEIMDLPRTQVIGSRVTELKCPFVEHPEPWIQVFAEVVRTGESMSMEYYSDSMRRHFALNAYRAQPGQIATVVTDISDRIHLDEEMRKSRNLQSLGVLAGGIAHEFNNMLTGVMGGLSLLREGFVEDSSEYEIAMLAENSAKKSRKLTQQLITFAKGGRPIKTPIELTHLIAETVSSAVDNSSVKAIYKFPDMETTAKVDRQQITQVIDNLTQNGIEAMPDGGLLTVELQSKHVSTDDSLPLAPGRYLKLSFTDQGVGIPEETIESIFDPYFSTKPMAQGLGLSIAHSIVQRHDGTILVESRTDQGSTFDVYLPARTD